MRAAIDLTCDNKKRNTNLVLRFGMPPREGSKLCQVEFLQNTSPVIAFGGNKASRNAVKVIVQAKAPSEGVKLQSQQDDVWECRRMYNRIIGLEIDQEFQQASFDSVK